MSYAKKIAPLRAYCLAYESSGNGRIYLTSEIETTRKYLIEQQERIAQKTWAELKKEGWLVAKVEVRPIEKGE